MTPSEASLRERLAPLGSELTSWGNGAGDHYAEHRHAYDKVLVAVAGSIVFHLPEADEDVLLEPGDRLDLPAGTLHGADVGAEGVTCLEAHVAAGSLGPGTRKQAGWGAEPAD